MGVEEPLINMGFNSLMDGNLDFYKEWMEN
jgi:hypothetical protein